MEESAVLKKDIRPFILLTALFLIVAFWGPQIYYSTLLPAPESIKTGYNSREIFVDWELNSNSAILADRAYPPKVFQCSLCFPGKIASSDCADRIAYFVARNLNKNSDKQASLIFHLKNYFIGKALKQKYTDENLYKLYLTFVGDVLGPGGLGIYCNKNFGKGCEALNSEEAIELEIATRAGASGKQVSINGPSANIRAECIK